MHFHGSCIKLVKCSPSLYCVELFDSICVHWVLASLPNKARLNQLVSIIEI